MITVTVNYELPEDADELKLTTNAGKMAEALQDVALEAREMLKLIDSGKYTMATVRTTLEAILVYAGVIND